MKENNQAFSKFKVLWIKLINKSVINFFTNLPLLKWSPFISLFPRNQNLNEQRQLFKQNGTRVTDPFDFFRLSCNEKTNEKIPMVWWHWQQIDKEIDCKLLNHHMVNLILSSQETVFMVPQVIKFSTFSTSSTIRYTSELYNVYVKVVHDVWVYSHFDVLLWGNLLIDMSAMVGLIHSHKC